MLSLPLPVRIYLCLEPADKADVAFVQSGTYPMADDPNHVVRGLAARLGHLFARNAELFGQFLVPKRPTT